MVALFALGVMSVGWMALVGVFIAVENLFPWNRIANRSVADPSVNCRLLSAEPGMGQ
jgi:predicted metal-binding membrane protein